MALAPGDRLGPYEILASIGAGGMGQVWKARDPRLDRTIAIKTSTAHFTDRFEREARAIAALNHSHICQIYDVGPDYLVMEYIEGAPLKGPLPLDQAIKYATQIAAALDAAHRKGIAHRDLKPANILVTKSGIKLLDFGLAKTEMSPAVPVDGDAMTRALTGRNEIVGTLYYMSPEQLQPGVRQVDTRTDIFSFGLVLYEMLTGKMAFAGESAASTIAAILERPAPSIAAVAPPLLDRILQRCLAKDPDDRWQSARDLMSVLSEVSSTSNIQESKPGARRVWLPVACAIVLTALVMAAAFSILHRSDTPHISGSWRLSINPPPGMAFSGVDGVSRGTPEISPDGTMVVASIGSQLYLRRLASTTWIPLRGTEGAAQPFWSPDSQFLGFDDKHMRLMTMRLPDGAPEPLRPMQFYKRGAAWSSRGMVMNAGDGLLIGPAVGYGKGEQVLPLADLKGVMEPKWPQFLPDGEHFLFSGYDLHAGSADQMHGIYLASWSSGRLNMSPKRILTNSNAVRYSPANGGSVLFVRNDNVYAQHLDLAKARLDGDAQLLVEGVASGAMFGIPRFSVSNSGTLVWRPGRASLSQVTAFDRSGKMLDTTGPPDGWCDIELSPDERRFAASSLRTDLAELYVLESGKSAATHLETSKPDRTMGLRAHWMPGGDSLLYIENQPGPSGQSLSYLVQQSVGGGGHKDWGLGPYWLDGISPDGRSLLAVAYEENIAIAQRTNTKGTVTISFPPDSTPPKSIPVSAFSARFSPDANWLVYHRTSGDGYAVFVRPTEGNAAETQISLAEGAMPVWRADGKEILYLGDDNRIWSVPVDLPSRHFGKAVPLFAVRPATLPRSRPIAVTRDGSRIYFLQAVEQPEGQINVLPDWTAAVPRK